MVDSEKYQGNSYVLVVAFNIYMELVYLLFYGSRI